MTNRVISRKALAIVSASLLASPFIVQSASAQSSNTQQNITTSAKFVGPVPTGVTGVNVTVDCQSLTTATGFSGTQILTAGFGSAGGSTQLAFGLNAARAATATTPASLGSSCRVIAVMQGSANTTIGNIQINVGGTAYAGTSTTAANVVAGTPLANTATTGFVPAWSATDVTVTVSYPQITVKKVVLGDEPKAGFDYPMSINCATPDFQSWFISSAAGTYYTRGYGVSQLVTNGATLTLPAGVATAAVASVSAPTRVYFPGSQYQETTQTQQTFNYYTLVTPTTAGTSATLNLDSTGNVSTVTNGTAVDVILPVGSVTPGNDFGNGVTSANYISFTAEVGSPAVVTNFIVFDGFRIPPAVFDRNTGQLATAGVDGDLNKFRAALVARLDAYNQTGTVKPIGTVNGQVIFDGTFTLKGGASFTIGNSQFPNLRSDSVCEVRELNNQGGVTLYSSTNTKADGSAGTPIPGTDTSLASGNPYRSGLTKMNETVTVTNAFYGDLIVSKVVTGDSKTNIATFEIEVACDKGGPKDTFLLKDRQSKVYNNIAVGTSCRVTELKSDGAVASYSDNTGEDTTDGRVTIKTRGVGCLGSGTPTVSNPGGPSPVTSFNECFANVIVTNDYNPPATTAAPVTTVAPVTAAPATAAPAVSPAPATPVEATATFTG